MRKLLLLIVLLLSGLAPLAARGTAPAEVTIYDRTARQVLPIHLHDGRRYVAGEPGHEYEIRISSRNTHRMLAVASVDGINVITGETAAMDQGGYVVDAHGAAILSGWRKSLEDVAAFYFAALPDSYAAQTGRPDDVGVIGVALFRERARPCCDERLGQSKSREYPASTAPDAALREGAEGDATHHASSPRLGTGHGQRLASFARYVDFERASVTPDDVFTIYYDSRRNLLARGILPRPHFSGRTPDPFPGGFAPDP